MQSLRSIFVIAFFVTAGCGLPTLDLRDQLDLHRVSFYDKLTANPPPGTRISRLYQTGSRRAEDRPWHSGASGQFASRHVIGG